MESNLIQSISMESNSLNDISELEAVDKGFGAHIVSSLKSLSADAGSSHYRRFMKRDSKQQVYRGEEQDPKSFVRALKSYQSHEKKQENHRLNKVELPLIYYYRTLDMEAALPDMGIMLQDSTGWDDGLLESFSLSMGKLVLTYKVCFVASDKATAQRLALGWYFHIMNKRKGQHRFTVRHNVAGTDFDVPSFIIDPQTFNAINVSQEKMEGRLFALECEHKVLSPILFGRKVSVADPVRWELSVGTIS